MTEPVIAYKNPSSNNLTKMTTSTTTRKCQQDNVTTSTQAKPAANMADYAAQRKRPRSTSQCNDPDGRDRDEIRANKIQRNLDRLLDMLQVEPNLDRLLDVLQNDPTNIELRDLETKYVHPGELMTEHRSILMAMRYQARCETRNHSPQDPSQIDNLLREFALATNIENTDGTIGMRTEEYHAQLFGNFSFDKPSTQIVEEPESPLGDRCYEALRAPLPAGVASWAELEAGKGKPTEWEEPSEENEKPNVTTERKASIVERVRSLKRGVLEKVRKLSDGALRKLRKLSGERKDSGLSLHRC